METSRDKNIQAKMSEKIFAIQFDGIVANRFNFLGIIQKILSNLQCQGVERNISHCGHRGWRRSQCNHYEDAGVKCHVPQLQGHKVC